MTKKIVKINWPNSKSSFSTPGEDWLKAANDANIEIPTGCLGGSCGACEIEVNGKVTRACIDVVPSQNEINIEFFSDPYW
tara:strand:- start:629 stop:868 length:240 start_codon:yes stop_codon:yes gene_type:complete